MSYCTANDLIARFSIDELNQLIGNGSTYDAAIADATADIDAALVRYTLPLTIVPEKLGRIACDLSRYYLYSDLVPEVVQKRYDNATSYLLALAKGTILLSPDVNGSKQEAAGSTVHLLSDTPVFDMAGSW